MPRSSAAVGCAGATFDYPLSQNYCMHMPMLPSHIEAGISFRL